jgi:hypothetical protein
MVKASYKEDPFLQEITLPISMIIKCPTTPITAARRVFFFFFLHLFTSNELVGVEHGSPTHKLGQWAADVLLSVTILFSRLPPRLLGYVWQWNEI